MMAYQSLYRRFRPRRFGEVYGQDHVVTALRNSVREGRVGHAYLFSGPRGTGKTTTARILAKVLNCEHPADGEPDLECGSCVAIEAGTSFDLHELDAASNNKVDDIRDLVERVAYATPGRTKVYILDEVHMLTPSASAALLKTLEEPPDDVVFVLATTDPQKVIPTIRSRTQHFAFHLLPAKELEEYLRYVIDAAGLEVSPEALEHAMTRGAGSARDTLSALEMVVAAGGVHEPSSHVDELIEALAARDTGQALSGVARAVADGRDPRVMAEALLARLRDVFLAAMRADLSYLPDLAREHAVVYAERFERPYITRCLEVIGEALVDMRQAPDPRVGLDIALVRLTNVQADTSLAALAERVTRLERRLGEADPQAETPPDDPTPAPAPSPAAPRSVRPADAARQALAEHGPTVTPIPTPTSTATPIPSAAPAGHDRKPAEPATVDAPNRDDLTLAWGDTILARLPQHVRVRWSVGRFVDSDGATARFALPNPMHRERCESQRPEVERALSEHFGRPVRIELAVDDDVPAAHHPAPAPSAQAPEADEIDPSELVDAPSDTRSAVDLFSEQFEGVQLVEEEEHS